MWTRKLTKSSRCNETTTEDGRAEQNLMDKDNETWNKGVSDTRSEITADEIFPGGRADLSKLDRKPTKIFKPKRAKK